MKKYTVAIVSFCAVLAFGLLWTFSAAKPAKIKSKNLTAPQSAKLKNFTFSIKNPFTQENMTFKVSGAQEKEGGFEVNFSSDLAGSGFILRDSYHKRVLGGYSTSLCMQQGRQSAFCIVPREKHWQVQWRYLDEPEGRPESKIYILDMDTPDNYVLRAEDMDELMSVPFMDVLPRLRALSAADLTD